MTLIYLGVLLELGMLTELGFIEFDERIQMYFQSICLRLKRVASNSLSSVHSPISPNKTEIRTFSKAFAKVDSNDDFLLTFELGYSKTQGYTG